VRFVIATVLLVISAVSIALGFILKGPFEANNYHEVSFKVQSPYSYVVIPHETLTAYQGEISVQATGTKEIFYADARERDIQDWIGTSNFVRLNLNPSTLEPDISQITAGGDNANPEGSDMWRTAIKVKNTLLTQVNMFDDTGVLLASDGLAHAPGDITVKWQMANIINWPLVLIFGGLALLVIALIFNYLAFRHVRRLRGPKRRIPKAPRGPKYRKRVRPDVPLKGRRRVGRKMVIAPASLITLSLLTGCSTPSGVADQEKAQYPSVKVVLTDAQLQRVVREVAATVKQSDTNRNEALLITRVAGPALETRKIQYLLQVKSKKIPKLPDIVANPITVALPMSSPDESLGWQPRTLMVVTKSDSTTRAPQMLVLQQETPRSNYRLWYLIDLLPTANFPKVAAQEVGSIPIDANNAYLATKLTSIPFKYGNALNLGAESKFAENFDFTADKFYAAVSEYQAQQKEELKKVKVSIKFVHTLGNPNIIGMSTVDGGGLIAIAMNDTSIIKPQVRGSAVSVTQTDHKILLGAPGSSTGLNIVYENMMLFYVPVAGSNEKIRLVGASQGILSVKALN
jgi:hypothetical protein